MLAMSVPNPFGFFASDSDARGPKSYARVTGVVGDENG
jgi:hypothetical protein